MLDCLKILFSDNKKTVLYSSDGCNLEIFNLFKNFYYLSFSNVFKVKNYNELSKKPIDYYVKNYVNFNEVNALIKNVRGEYHLCLYSKCVDKKRKNTDFIIKRYIKIDKNAINFDLMDNEFVEVNILSNYDVSILNDKEINSFINNKIFLFEDGVGVDCLKK